MGAQNVGKVFAYWRHLGHKEARALTFMALTALDADKPPVYFGGWAAVAEALGLDPDKKHASASEVFRKTLAALVKAGAVVSSGHARQGVRAEYALALDPAVTFAPLDSGRNGSGRGVSWLEIPRDISRESRESEPSPNESLPQLPQQIVAPHPNESLPQEPQRNVGLSPNEALPPMSTEDPRGGIAEEPHIRTTQSARPKVNGTRAKNHQRDEPPKRSMEDERRKQLDALEKLMAAERKAS